MSNPFFKNHGPILISEILKSIINAGLINKKSIGVLELPKSTLQNELSFLSIIKEKKISNSLFLFFEIN